MWPRGSTINDVVVIGVEEGGLYKLKGSPEQALFHSTIDPCELWHRRFAHLHYRALPSVSKAVLGIPELKSKHEGVWKGCAQGKNMKKPFSSSESKAKGILDIIHSDVLDLWQPHLSMGTVIMSLSLMISLEKLGYTS